MNKIKFTCYTILCISTQSEFFFSRPTLRFKKKKKKKQEGRNVNLSKKKNCFPHNFETIVNQLTILLHYFLLLFSFVFSHFSAIYVYFSARIINLEIFLVYSIHTSYPFFSEKVKKEEEVLFVNVFTFVWNYYYQTVMWKC